ncbi:MAG: hypothetical protein QXN96_02740 [Candidatus Bathyarchaeia archaeon]
MVDLWKKRLKDLTGLTLADLRTHTIKELIQKLPTHLQNDPDIKPFLWKLSIYITQHHLRQTQAQEQELQDLYERIQKRLEDIPAYLRRKPKT